MIIDARGQSCPRPVMMAEEALAKVSEGIVEVLVDNEASADNLAWFAKNNAYFSETAREGNDWRVKIVKGYVCAAPAAKDEREASEKDLLVIIGTDTMGKEADLGRILMKAYFETMKTYKELPHTMVFLNAGVRLTTVSELKVGHRGTTNHIVEGMKDFKKNVWIG